MPNTVINKRTEIAARKPTPAQLEVGEIASNILDRKLYTKNTAGDVVEFFQRWATLTELTAEDPAVDGDRYHVTGSRAVDDLGGGSFRYDAAMPKTMADGGMVIDSSVPLTTLASEVDIAYQTLITGNPAATQTEIDNTRAAAETAFAGQGTGTGNGCYVRVATVIKPEYFGLTDDFHNRAINSAITSGWVRNMNVHCENHYKIGGTILLTDPTKQYWNGSTVEKPITIKFNRLSCSTSFNGLMMYSYGRVGAGKIDIEWIEGNGVDFTYDPVQTITNILASDLNVRTGILIERGGHNITINGAQNLNGVLQCTSAWSADIKMGPTTKCGKTIVSRGKSQAITCHLISTGGVYNSTTFADDADRRAWSGDIALDLEGMRNSFFHCGALQYVTMQDDSIGLKVAADSRNNVFYAHVEGMRRQGHFIHNLGRYNKFYVEGGNSPVSPKGGEGGFFFGGLGNEITMDRSFNVATSTSTFTTTSSVCPLVVLPGNKFNGSYISPVLKDKVALTGRLVDETTARVDNVGAGATLVENLVDPPSAFRGATKWLDIDSPDQTEVSLEFGPINVNAANTKLIRVECAAKNRSATGQAAQVAVYVKDQSGLPISDADGIGGQTVSLHKDGYVIHPQFIEEIKDTSNFLTVVVTARNPSNSGTAESPVLGVSCSVAVPYLSFEIDDDGTSAKQDYDKNSAQAMSGIALDGVMQAEWVSDEGPISAGTIRYRNGKAYRFSDNVTRYIGSTPSGASRNALLTDTPPAPENTVVTQTNNGNNYRVQSGAWVSVGGTVPNTPPNRTVDPASQNGDKFSHWILVQPDEIVEVDGTGEDPTSVLSDTVLMPPPLYTVIGTKRTVTNLTVADGESTMRTYEVKPIKQAAGEDINTWVEI